MLIKTQRTRFSFFFSNPTAETFSAATTLAYQLQYQSPIDSFWPMRVVDGKRWRCSHTAHCTRRSRTAFRYLWVFRSNLLNSTEMRWNASIHVHHKPPPAFILNRFHGSKPEQIWQAGRDMTIIVDAIGRYSSQLQLNMSTEYTTIHRRNWIFVIRAERVRTRTKFERIGHDTSPNS